jgi:hypothetical protein
MSSQIQIDHAIRESFNTAATLGHAKSRIQDLEALVRFAVATMNGFKNHVPDDVRQKFGLDQAIDRLYRELPK